MVIPTPADLHPATPDFTSAGDCPLVAPLPPQTDLREVFLRLCHLPHCLWLDSAKPMPDLGRYSFLTADPIEIVSATDDDADPLAKLQKFIPLLSQAAAPGLPPFQGGLAGVLGYELGRSLEPIPAPRFNDLPTPPLCVGLYDWTIAVDHQQNRGWIISQGWPETDPDRRRVAAARRMQQIQWWLGCTPTAMPRPPRSAPRAHDALAPQFRTPIDPSLTSNFAPGEFRTAVGDVIDYIRRGDAFQVNLAQRLLYPDQHGAVAAYLRMRSRNAAPFAGYFDGGDWQVVSASPERFLQIDDRFVETRPIKGTCPRTGDAAVDQQLGAQLLSSLKDRAENVMIVDLMRNDLSRVCNDDSIDVAGLCELEQYECVQHLVSRVHGRLRDDVDVVDLLRASFPGGSITGAPKVRAMQIIAELEPTARGPYCGSLGYLSTGGRGDLNILIRTVTCRDGWLQMPVGGGITSRSKPEQEEQETWDKAEGMLRAVL
ncbi:Aminodeoxychorismate synthase component 1 [Rosistilla ulvae]|uniref:Aminodeoxychorismate synthase component 1 n=1 Tax=Rosistilla ulvae TaxID=1930277 RepID=A0A517LY38_9BACT|nr:anthranilate synthase component I family protein [Rosistilla ulvae]QDS87541.1 Aminodeoxychorismate synthase component 1 [Rosistilla ulvae]